MPLACCSDPFSAPAVDSWVHLIEKDPSTSPMSPSCPHTGATPSTPPRAHIPGTRCSHSMFSAYAILEGIGASICEERILGRFNENSVKGYEQDLVSWYKTYGERVKGKSDPLCLLILWHWLFMSVFTDFNRLELAIGKEGTGDAAAEAAYALEWSSSVDSRRCLLHAFLLQKQLESMLLRRVLPIHVPRCLFSAAIAWFCYLRSAQYTALDLSSVEGLRFPEMEMLKVNAPQQWSEGIGFRSGSLSVVKGNTLCTLADMLRQVSHWDIAQNFARIIGPLIHGGVDDSLATH
jgi:hypothetical protein